MKKLLLSAVFSAALLSALLPALPASAGIVEVRNLTKDRWVWVTVYNTSKSILGGQFCVGPNGRGAAHYPNAVGYVRGEVTTRAACHHPKVGDTWVPANGQGSQAKWEGRLSGPSSSGAYSFGGYFVRI